MPAQIPPDGTQCFQKTKTLASICADIPRGKKTPQNAGKSVLGFSGDMTGATTPTRPRRGRPPNSVTPLTKWLRGVIRRMRREGYGCAEIFHQLYLVEDADGDDQVLGFTVSEETASEVWRDVGGDLVGARVTWESFRKTWQRTR